MTGRIDTVPLGDQPWIVDPFAGAIEDGRIYGRGTTDMKGGVAAIVVAAINLAERLATSPGVILVITGGEERVATAPRRCVKRQARWDAPARLSSENRHRTAQ